MKKMGILENLQYCNEIRENSKMNIQWERLRNKTVMISGATGLIGSYMIDLIMYNNLNDNLNCKIVALVRNEKNAKERFDKYGKSELLEFVKFDLNNAKDLNYDGNINYVIHLASNTHPKAYALDPIGTITTNVIGTYNLLNLAWNKKIDRFVFISSCEIYGENKGDIEKFDEEYLGYINCNALRSGYPESKRCGESLCQAFISQKNLDIVIPRLSRIYGPTMSMSDTKAISQFIKNAIKNENIVLKSEGTQYYSYLYVADAVYAILKIMLDGGNGEAYNVADESSDIHLRDLAKMISEVVDTNVIFELPDDIEKKGFSRATKACLDNGKLKELGWSAKYDIKNGIETTLNILSKI